MSFELPYVKDVHPCIDTQPDKVTDPTMTPNEYIALLAHRARQLKVGVTPVVEWKGRFDAVAIAKKEIDMRLIPLVIVRRVPDSKSETGFCDEIWDVKDMDIRDY